MCKGGLINTYPSGIDSIGCQVFVRETQYK